MTERRCPSRAADESGSGAVLLLAAAAVIGLALLVALAVGSVTSARHRAQSAADLAALAAAGQLGPAGGTGRGEDPCGVARKAAAVNGARLQTCTVAQSSVLVVVSLHVTLPRLLGGQLTVRAGARAGREPRPGAARPRRHGSGRYRDVIGRTEFQA